MDREQILKKTDWLKNDSPHENINEEVKINKEQNSEKSPD
jgi:hypothetical protein